ncbi:hypothetical protein PPTG_12842 [Phytophthora nicotianae INRA-310]|uniref:Uncharacterized protein n=2 Tax=Phytophthora nicotianae TaxID=4792 RepID=W2Q2T3_PHYN3|nr:hypothetical protein PPTG_12842 [Phytophthora nicotianae INRA-310]ETI43400.1 hypothetical protein F443_11646 [Phytophthora nicotianae P1569]ETN06824.1 hypothetical protein PPTG_12842 [Phytophthora nicotianae INRA-310]
MDAKPETSATQHPTVKPAVKVTPLSPSHHKDAPPKSPTRSPIKSPSAFEQKPLRMPKPMSI